MNTLLVQDILNDDTWTHTLTDEDKRGLTPLFWTHLAPYGEVKLNMDRRLISEYPTRAAADFDAFYATRQPPAGVGGDVLVLSCDGKGIVMRPDALRPATAAAAAKATGKLATRLSKGEKRHRKRLAELGTVYDATPAARGPTDILARRHPARRRAGPRRHRARTGHQSGRSPGTGVGSSIRRSRNLSEV